MSLALEQPQGCTGASLGCSRARDILGSLRPRPEKTTCSFPYRFSGKSRNSGLVPGNRDQAQKDSCAGKRFVWAECYYLQRIRASKRGACNLPVRHMCVKSHVLLEIFARAQKDSCAGKRPVWKPNGHSFALKMPFSAPKNVIKMGKKTANDT